MITRSCGRFSRSVLVLALVGAVSMTSAPPAPSAEIGEWQRSPGGLLHAVVVDDTGMIFVAGSVRATKEAMTVAKYDPTGTLLWRRQWRPSGDASWFADAFAVAPAPSGGVYVGGQFGQYEGWAPVLRSYSSDGHLLWRRILPAPLGRGSIVSLASDADGVVGAVMNSDTGGPTAEGNYLYAWDHDGNRLWRTEFHVPGIRGTMNGINDVAIDENGNIDVVGFVDRQPLDARWQDWDVVVQQRARTGGIRWTWVSADRARDLDAARAVDVAPGLVVASGDLNDSTRGGVWAFTSDGERIWRRTWDGEDQTSAPAVTISPWGPVYAAWDQVVYGPGEVTTTTASLRRYEADGTYASSRAAEAYVSDVTAADALYVTAGKVLSRWLP